MQKLKNAIINSFHSSTLNLLAIKPKSVVSFDSHLDIDEGSKRFLEMLFNLTFPLRGAFLRNYVHSLLRRGLPNTPLYLIVPRTAFECNNVQRSRDSQEVIKKELNKVISDDEALEEANAIALDLLKGLGIHLFLSPPKNLKYLSEKVDKFSTVIDVDVDYMEEFQKVCYSKAPQFIDVPGHRHLGHLSDVTKTIDRIRPDLVLVSEMRLEQIKGQKPPFANLIDFLKSRGYEIEYGEIVESDEAAFEALKIFDRFQNEVMPGARHKIATSGWKDFEAVFDDLCVPLKQLLEEKRYTSEN